MVGLFDPSSTAAETLSRLFPTARVCRSESDALSLKADLVIVASPPAAHRMQTIAALQSGSHVLCEKPLATRPADAREMVDAAQRGHRLLGVNFIRRQFPVVKAIEELLKSGALGEVGRVSCFEGGPFAWPVSSPRYFSMEQSGGGVLMDIGTHGLDLLIGWFGEPQSLNYQDDAMGGVEANCRLKARFGPVEADIHLSRDWPRPNLYRFEGSRGTLIWPDNEPATLKMVIHQTGQTVHLEVRDADECDEALADFVDCFAAQLRAMVDAVRGMPLRVATGEDGLRILELVHQCYAARQSRLPPWLTDKERARGQALRLRQA